MRFFPALESAGRSQDPAAPAAHRSTPRELALLLGVVLGALALFLPKAFTMDDPLFLWLGRQILADPLDFFGFTVNWYGTETPMHEITQNPPLSGYYIAAAAAVLGWSEVALHGAFLIPAAAVAVTTYGLARRCCRRPLEASLAGLLTPAFLVSSSTVMSDVMMLAFWCAAVWCWLEGLDRGRRRWLLGAGLLAGLATLTKYYGIALVPLLAAYAWLRLRRVESWAAFLLVPIGLLLLYEGVTWALYGGGHFFGAAAYAGGSEEGRSFGFGAQLLTGLVFAGGCLPSALFYAPWLWSRWVTLGGLALVGAGLAYAGGDPSKLIAFEPWLLGHARGPIALHILLMAAGGASLLGLALADLLRRRDPESVLLAFWLLGTFAFAGFVNWVNNGRSNLPMAPVLGILIVRRLEVVDGWRWSARRRRLLLALLPAALVALTVAWADYRWANDVRADVRHIAHRWIRPDRNNYFYGHWGFQYYMQLAGARPRDLDRDVVSPGELLVLPFNNAFGAKPGPGTKVLERWQNPAPRYVHIVDKRIGACFYASNIGPLPFVFAKAGADRYLVWELQPGFQSGPRQPPREQGEEQSP